jgi:hypothetical protein
MTTKLYISPSSRGLALKCHNISATASTPSSLPWCPPPFQGDEVAAFAYGGSIVTTIFGHGAITCDADLVTHSRNNAETVVSYGNSLGHATGHPHSHAPAGAAQE